MIARIARTVGFPVALCVLVLSVANSFAQSGEREHVSAEEAAFLATHHVIRLGVPASYPPFAYIGRDGSHQGIAAAYADIIARRLGVEFRVVAAATMADAIEDMRAGRVDVLAATGRTADREREMLFSQPYLTGPWAIVTRAETAGILKISDLDNHSVALVDTQAIRDTVQRTRPQMRLVIAKSVEDAMARVDGGEAFATIVSILSAGEVINSNFAGRLKIASTLPDIEHEVRFAIRRDWPELANAIDRALAAMPEEEHRRIRVLGMAREIPAAIDWARVAIYGGPLLAAIVVIMIAALIANRGMRREIERRRVLEKALIDNEERLRTILRSAPEGVITVDHAGRVTYWNPAAERIFGFSEAEALGSDVHQILTPSASRRDARQGMDVFAESGRGSVLNRVVELDALNRSGHTVPVDIARAAFRQDGEWHAVAFVRDTTEKRRSEKELLEAKAAAEASRRRLLDMSDALPCAVYQIRVDAQGMRRYAFVSKNVATVLGVDLETLRANEDARWRNVHEDDVRALRDRIEDVARRGDRLFCEYRVRLDGNLRWIRQEALRQMQQDGSAVWNGYWLDVTEIKRAETTLSDQLLFQRLLLDSLPNAVFFKGADGRFLGCNRACERMFGVPSSDLVGRTAAEIEMFPAEARWAQHEADIELIRDRTSRHLQTRMQFADGAEHEVLYWATGFALSDGRPGGMIGVVVDITEQKRAEDLVKETEQWYRSILETAPEGMLVADANGRITLVNEKTERLFGYRRDELLGRSVEMLIPARLRGAHRDHRHAYHASATARPMGTGRELYGLHKKGSEFPIEVALSPLPRRAGESLAVSASIRDISERKRAADALRDAKERAEEATQAKSMFLANMSHEIRTPMNAIIGMAHLALSTSLTARQRDYITKIHDASISLLSIINDILDFSKIEAGRMELERVEFSLDDVLVNVSMVIEQHAAEKGLEVLIHPPVDVPQTLVGDPLRLGQILTNLVINAVKFTERGEIELTSELDQRGEHHLRLHFAVRDTGVGMSTDQVERLFRPFTQADGSTTRRYGGTGLGLTICKRLVELMDGRIWAESKIGEGSTFHFTVSLDLGTERQPVSHLLPAGLSGTRVLVVDDHPVARQILVQRLSALPVRIDTAESARQALGAVRHADATDPFGVVFMDWKMPVVDGAEATRLIKSDSHLVHAPKVVMMTTLGHDEARAKAEAAGADAFVMNPTTRSVLVDTIVEVLTPPERLPAPEIASAEAQRLTGTRVLLVEDNEINQQIAVELLRAAGARVDVACNGREALDRLAAMRDGESYDAVLMDLQMPVMDGIEATRAIRMQRSLARLPVIAMTAHALVEEREQCLAAGMTDHLAKPIDPDALIATLQRWTQRSDTSLEFLRGIDGLDYADGLRRVAGARDLYISLLDQFAREEQRTPARIRKALQDGDRNLAERLAHTTKGVAANIGAHRVRQAAATIESALRAGADDVPAVAGALDELDSASTRLVSALKDRLPAPASRERAGAVVHGAETDTLRRLADLLAQYDGEAVEYFDAARTSIRQSLDPVIYARVERALRGYRFEEGLAALRAVLPATTP